MISLKDAAAAAKAFVQAGRGKVVSDESIRQRTTLCMGCPKRRKVKVRPAEQASRILGMMANKNRVRKEIKDYKCGVCKCSLMLLLPALPEHLHDDSPAQAKSRAAEAPQCWIPGAKREAGDAQSG